MEYLKKYDINQDQIMKLKSRYNDRIIDFLTEESDFLAEKLGYLKEEGYKIYPILENNIKLFLEEMFVLQNKIRKMEEKGYSKKAIQMILMNEQFYDNI